METKANYVLIGAFTLGVVAFLLLFALWAARWSSQQAWDFYDVVFTEAVTGLSEGASVQYNGIAVGTVIGVSSGNIGMGIGVGIALGIAMSRAFKPRDRDEP